jgi:hypothetical protein
MDLEEDLLTWPNCATPDCEYKANRWAGLGLCTPCSTRVLGEVELQRRYDATRVSPADRRWSGEVFQEAR